MVRVYRVLWLEGGRKTVAQVRVQRAVVEVKRKRESCD
jgi:hypothetical protein